jgi:hypothetical protein
LVVGGRAAISGIDASSAAITRDSQNNIRQRPAEPVWNAPHGAGLVATGSSPAWLRFQNWGRHTAGGGTNGSSDRAPPSTDPSLVLDIPSQGTLCTLSLNRLDGWLFCVTGARPATDSGGPFRGQKYRETPQRAGVAGWIEL